ncbi:related to sterol glucosyltransferase [Rhynchosporium agropyri]|uniref:Related to sterol glucosyltransferase n=1 Tax=Rhynchosporium agropyri TaxID=914238 RepID=A0A1E1JYG4_9HELO|nr:related to sterol glucosyltransferase [Rhynchosporium agropyri]
MHTSSSKNDIDIVDESQVTAAASGDFSSKSLMNETANVTDNGRINVNLDSRLSRALSRLIPAPAYESAVPSTPPPQYEKIYGTVTKLNIVIQVVGSRGDVQPFIALGNELQKHGHRVRIATHDVFEDFVRKPGIEFYPIGDDPADLMAYMVKNPGLMPSVSSLRAGDVQSKRKMITMMLDGCWRSCIEADSLTRIPFTADAIIANPPSFAHVHCAQALGCPVHIMFTMPWSCTRDFPHPLANLKSTNEGKEVQSGRSNYLSYMIVEWMTWQGLGDVINKWRKSIDLEPIPETEGPLLVETLKIPFTYCWSPALVAKPQDWPSHVDVCGFFFRDAPDFTPDAELERFLHSGPSAVYIGFGSIVIDDPNEMTAMLLEAVRSTGVRALISRGWSKLGAGRENDSQIHFLGDCPHEWLFQHVAAVVHHGGAGTTACGLLNGRPTTIVPFFGDQPFWGHMVAAAGAGPRPLAYKELTSQKIADAIQFCLKPEALTAAAGIALKMRKESGVKTAVESFHRGLPAKKMQCEVVKGQPAVWIYKSGKRRIQLSRIGAQILSDHLRLDLKKLQFYEAAPQVIEIRRWDPVTGAASAAIGMPMTFLKETTGIITKPFAEFQNAREQKLLTANAIAHRNLGSPKSSSDTLASLQHSRVSNSTSPETAGKMTGGQIAGAMIGASVKSLGNAVGKPWKGFFVDVPLAVADGLHAIPKMYGEEVTEREKITDIKSGVVVAGKSFLNGIAGGLAGLVIEPCKGAKKEGVLGVAKGLGKGSLGLFTKAGSAGIGLVAYPGQGICKSVYTTWHAKTRKLVVAKRIEEGEFTWQNAASSMYDVPAILERFHNLRNGIDKDYI